MAGVIRDPVCRRMELIVRPDRISRYVSGLVDRQLVPRAPHASREHATAGVDLVAAGRAARRTVAAVVVGVPERHVAVAPEPVGEAGVVEDDHADRIRHALAVRALPAAARRNEVVTVLVIHDGAEARVGAAPARAVEVDGRAAVRRNP